MCVGIRAGGLLNTGLHQPQSVLSILYYTILYYTILYYTILYYTTLPHFLRYVVLSVMQDFWYPPQTLIPKPYISLCIPVYPHISRNSLSKSCGIRHLQAYLEGVVNAGSVFVGCGLTLPRPVVGISISRNLHPKP